MGGGAALRGLATLAVCVVALGGCARAPARFSKPGATEQVFMQDRYACIQQSQQNRGAANAYVAYTGVIVNRGVFMSCMGARGYLLDPNGSLAAQPGTEIRMVN